MKKLSKNFYLKEFTKSATATKYGIDNNIHIEKHRHNLNNLIINLLQPLRNSLGEILTINSGYRSLKLNKKLKGATNSQHCLGMAVDIECHSISTIDLFNFIRNNYDYDQIILEFYYENDPASGWVHVSYNHCIKNRNQALRADKKRSAFGRLKTVYTQVNS